MAKYKLHELACKFPSLIKEDFAGLVESIKKNGQRDPITLWRGEVIDGRHRLQACQELGVEPLVQELPDDQDPVEYVIDKNIERRDLTPAQRAYIAVEIPGYRNGEMGNGRKVGAPAGAPTFTIKEKSKRFRVGERSINRAAAVRESNEKLYKSLRTGLYEVNDAHNIKDEDKDLVSQAINDTKESTSPGKLKKHIDRSKYEMRRNEKEISRNDTPIQSCDLYNISCEELIEKVPDGSVDAIITDPPYPQEFLSCYEELGKFSKHALREGGSLVCMIGHSWILEVMDYLREYLNYNWILSYPMEKSRVQVFPRKAIVRYRPVVHFVKGKYEGEWFQDEIKTGAPDKGLHEWGQDLEGFTSLVKIFTYPGNTIADPFLGGGTTAVAARNEKCKFIGADTDEKCIEDTKRRLSDG